MSKIATNKTKIKQRIEALEKQSQSIRGDLQDELEITKAKVVDIGKIAIGVSAGLIFSAIILRGLVGKRSNKSKHLKHGSKRVYQRFMNQLMSELSFQASKFVLGIAKDKLNSHAVIKKKTGDDDSDITG
jgi:hypothetical protein